MKLKQLLEDIPPAANIPDISNDDNWIELVRRSEFSMQVLKDPIIITNVNDDRKKVLIIKAGERCDEVTGLAQFNPNKGEWIKKYKYIPEFNHAIVLRVPIYLDRQERLVGGYDWNQVTRAITKVLRHELRHLQRPDIPKPRNTNPRSAKYHLDPSEWDAEISSIADHYHSLPPDKIAQIKSITNLLNHVEMDRVGVPGSSSARMGSLLARPKPLIKALWKRGVKLPLGDILGKDKHHQTSSLRKGNRLDPDY